MNWLEQKILGLFVKTKGKLSSPIVGGKGLIFMLHRVLPENEREQYNLNKDLAISTEKLEEFIVFFKEKGYDFISLDELSNWLDGKIKLEKKFICLTFDDGYRDNLIHGLPILQKHQVPATIYITNCLPNGNGLLWWYYFEEFAQKANCLILNSSIGKFEFGWKDSNDAFSQFQKVSEAIKSIPSKELHEVLKNSFQLTNEEIAKQCREISLTWDEIKMLSTEPLITIGAHTMNHVCVKQQNDQLVREEILNSKLEIENKIDKKVAHFAYPFGGEFDVSIRDIGITASLGFKTSTLNQPGNIFKSNRSNKQALARMPLGNRTENERMNNYLNGIYHYSSNQFSHSVKIYK
jgi:peptidoglycan/xylan/chitin deacetylase (PgdA/CDA1 family)